MNPLLRSFLAEGAPHGERLQRFLASERFPLVDRRGVTFVYVGEATAVNLRLWISGLPTSQPLELLAGESGERGAFWVLQIDLPENSRVEYKFEVQQGGHAEWILDPLNPLVANDPFGANSVCQGFGYQRPQWSLPDPAARAGTLEEFEIDSVAFGGPRRLQAYLPARFRRSRRYALLVVHDGEDYLRYAALKPVLDNLIHRLEVAPLIVAFTQSPDRLNEYAGEDRHACFVAEEVLGLMRERFPLEDSPAARGLMGASFGGVASLHAAWRYGGLFGRLLLQSGSFAFSDIGAHRQGPEFDPVVRFVNRFRAEPSAPTEKIYLSCGIYESLIYENRSILPLLRERGMEVRYEEARDGHNWENWRDRLRAGLSWLFPGPLWMIYE